MVATHPVKTFDFVIGVFQIVREPQGTRRIGRVPGPNLLWLIFKSSWVGCPSVW
tara:strand:- start:3398 stop:3559 length:162 start_codon:yes stop_codon:yes gene_type:complete